MTSGAEALPLPEGLPAMLGQLIGLLENVHGQAQDTQILSRPVGAGMLEGQWEGAAANARTAEAITVRNRLRDAVDFIPDITHEISQYEGLLDETRSEITSLQEQWDEAQADYLRRLRALNAIPFPDEDKQQIADGYANDRDAVHTELESAYTTTTGNLEDTGATVANTINGILEQIVPAATLGDPTAMGMHLAGGLDIAGSQVRAEHAAQQAEQFTDEVTEAIESGDDERLRELVETYGDLAQDPYFGYEVMNRLGIEGMDELYTWLAYHDGQANGRDAEARQEVMGLLGSIFVSAAGSAEGDILPDEYNYEEIIRWREEELYPSLADHGSSHQSLEIEGAWNAGGYRGYWLQGQFLTAAALQGHIPGEMYMANAGVDMIEWDRRAGDVDPQRDFSFAAPWGGGPNLIASGGDDDDRLISLADDPVHALLYAASQDESSAHALLLGELNARYDDDGDVIDEWNSVIGYLVNARGGTTAFSQPFQDQGELLAGIVADYGVDRDNEQSVELAGHYLNAMLDTLGAGTYANGVPVGEYAFAAARSATADVMIAHVEDFYEGWDSRTQGDVMARWDTSGEEPAYRIHFNRDRANSFESLFGELALDRPEDLVFDGEGDVDDPPALQRFLAHVMAHGDLTLRSELAGLEDVAPEEWNTSGANDAIEAETALLFAAVNGAGKALEPHAAAQDAYNEMITSMVKNGVGLISIPGGVAGRAGGLVLRETAESIMESMLHTSHVEDNDAATSANRETIRALIDQRVLTATHDHFAWADPEFTPETVAERHNEASGASLSFYGADGQPLTVEEILADPELEIVYHEFLDDDEAVVNALWEELLTSAELRDVIENVHSQDR